MDGSSEPGVSCVGRGSGERIEVNHGGELFEKRLKSSVSWNSCRQRARDNMGGQIKLR